MKKIINISILLTFMVILTNCERDLESEGLSRITYYPDFTITGDVEMILPVGTAYSEPGVTATESGADLDVTSSISSVFFPFSGSIDGNTIDRYIITYSAVNSDGYPGSTQRDVYVCNTGDLINS